MPVHRWRCSWPISPTHPSFYIHGVPLKTVDHFTYLGSTLSSCCSLDTEIHTRINKASSSFGRLGNRVFKYRNLKVSTKVAVYNVVCLSTLPYGAWIMDPIPPAHHQPRGLPYPLPTEDPQSVLGRSNPPYRHPQQHWLNLDWSSCGQKTSALDRAHHTHAWTPPAPPNPLQPANGRKALDSADSTENIQEEEFNLRQPPPCVLLSGLYVPMCVCSLYLYGWQIAVVIGYHGISSNKS